MKYGLVAVVIVPIAIVAWLIVRPLAPNCPSVPDHSQLSCVHSPPYTTQTGPDANRNSQQSHVKAAHSATSPSGSGRKDTSVSHDPVDIEPSPEAKSIVTDLMHTQIQDAVRVLDNEREMWAGFTSLKGTIDIAIGKTPESTFRLRGTVSIMDTPQPSTHDQPRPWKHDVILVDSEHELTIFSDGTAKGTRIECGNDKLAAEVASLHPEALAQLLTLPKDTLVPLYSDSRYPNGRYKRNTLFSSWVPWSNSEAQGTPHSYTFKNALGRTNSLSFEDGRVSRWVRIDPSGAPRKVSFTNHVESNRFWLPTVITLEGGQEDPRVVITISNAMVNQ